MSEDKTKDIINRVFDKVSDKLHEGDIILVKKQREVVHAGIWGKNPINTKQNFIHVVTRGLSYTNLHDFIHARWSKGFSLKIIRLPHGEAIAEQAKRWASEPVFKIKGDDVYLRYDHSVLLASYIIKYAETLGIAKEKIQAFRETLDRLSDENIAFLEYCKYAIRRSTAASRSKGLTCSSFVLLCLTIPLISDHIPEFNGEGLPPTLKHGNRSGLHLDFVPLKYIKAMDALNVEKPKFPGKEILFKALHLGFPPIINDIYFTDEEVIKGENYERIPIRTYQPNEKKQDTEQRISVIEFLINHEVDLTKLHADVRKRLRSLASLNPKIVSLDLLHQRLMEFHQATNASSTIMEITLESHLFLASQRANRNLLFHIKEDNLKQSSETSETSLSPTLSKL